MQDWHRLATCQKRDALLVKVPTAQPSTLRMRVTTNPDLSSSGLSGYPAIHEYQRRSTVINGAFILSVHVCTTLANLWREKATTTCTNQSALIYKPHWTNRYKIIGQSRKRDEKGICNANLHNTVLEFAAQGSLLWRSPLPTPPPPLPAGVELPGMSASLWCNHLEFIWIPHSTYGKLGKSNTFMSLQHAFQLVSTPFSRPWPRTPEDDPWHWPSSEWFPVPGYM